MRRLSVAVLAASVLALCGACGGSSGPAASGVGSGAGPSGGKAGQFDQTKYVRCLRDHGARVAEVGGGISIEAGTPDEERANAAAKKACQSLGPGGGEPLVPDATQLRELLRQAKCMRDHGIDVKDPAPPDYDIKISTTRDDEAKAAAAQRACLPGVPSGDGS